MYQYIHTRHDSERSYSFFCIEFDNSTRFAREKRDFESMVSCYYGDLGDTFALEVPQTRCMMQYDPSFIIHEINNSNPYCFTRVRGCR